MTQVHYDIMVQRKGMGFNKICGRLTLEDACNVAQELSFNFDEVKVIKVTQETIRTLKRLP